MVTFMGIRRTSGLTRADKKPFDMTKVICLAPIENVTRGNYSETGSGFKAVEYFADPVCLDAFNKLEMGDTIRLIMEPREQGFGTWVTDFKPVPNE